MFKHKLPENLIPIDDFCIPLNVPNDPDYVALLVRAIRTLTFDRHYERDENESAKIVRRQWYERTLKPLVDALEQEQTCLDFAEDEEGCNPMPLWYSRVEYHPMPAHPFNNPDFYPAGYLAPPFQLNENLSAPLPGYEPDDVIVSYDAVPLGLVPIWDLPTVLANGLPQIRITVQGSGQIELDLLTLPLGGMVMIGDGTEDIIQILLGNQDPPTTVDLGADIAIPPEIDIVSAQEINIEQEPTETTTIYLTWLPVLDDSLTPPVRFGGGIRSIQLCGFESEEITMSAGDIRLSPSNNCIIQQQQTDGSWLDVADLSNCNPPSGGGGGAVQAKITNYRVELPAIVENNTASWQEVAGSEITHNLEYENYTIIVGAQLGGLNATLAQFRVTTDGIFRGGAGEYHEFENTASGSQHATWATNISGAVPPVSVDIALQSIDISGTARIFPNTSIHYTVIETVEPISQSTIDDILNAIADLEISVGIHTTQISNMSANITAIISQINTINAQIASHQSQISANDADILALQISQTLQDATISDINNDIQALQINDALQDASIAQLVSDLEECCNDPEPDPVIDPLVTFDAGSAQWILTPENIGIISSGGNPNQCLFVQGADFFEQIALEIDLLESKQIEAVTFDAKTNNFTQTAVAVFVDGNQIGFQTSQTQNDVWQEFDFSEFFPITGQVVKVRYIVTSGIDNHDMALDNIFVDTGGV